MMRMRRYRWTALVVALSLTSSGLAVRANADENPQVEEAHRHFQQGVKYFDEQDYRAALIEFKRAYELSPRWPVLYDIGQTQYQLLDYASALGTLERYLAEGGAKIPADRKEKVESDVAELRRRVAKVTIVTNVAGAEISVDDVVVGTTPLAAPVIVSAGRRKFSATKAGAPPLVQYVDLAGGDVRELTLTLSVEAGPTPGTTTTTTTRGNSTIAWFGFALAGAGVAAGSVFGLLALGKRSDLDGVCNDKACPVGSQSNIDAMSRDATISTISFGVAVVGLGIGIYGVLAPSSSTTSEPPPPAAATITVSPWVSASSGGVGVLGAF